MRKANFCYEQSKNKEKVYLTGRVKEQIIWNKEGKDLSPIEISEIVPETIIRILIRGQNLKVIYNRILQQQRTETYLTIMLKIVNKENL